MCKCGVRGLTTCLVCCGLLFAPLGAKAAHSLDVAMLKRVFACLLFVLAAYMASKGLAG